jgi:uncharacterized protein (DUF2235 family)
MCTSRDTVNSVGIIPHRLPFTASNTIVRTFRHAVALDERRSKFKANLWNRPNEEGAKPSVEGQQLEAPQPDSPVNAAPNVAKANKKPKVKKQGTLRSWEKQFNEGQAREKTNIEEVLIFAVRFGNNLNLPISQGVVRWMPLR